MQTTYYNPFLEDEEVALREQAQSLTQEAQLIELRRRVQAAQRIKSLQGSGRTWGDALFGSGSASGLIDTGRNIAEMQEQGLARSGGARAILETLQGKDATVDVNAPSTIIKDRPRFQENVANLALDQLEKDVDRGVSSTSHTIREQSRVKAMDGDKVVNERALKVRQKMLEQEKRRLKRLHAPDEMTEMDFRNLLTGSF